MAKRLNTKALGINVSDMVVSGAYAYAIGSSIFSNTGDDAQILKIALSNGAVSVHVQLGRRYRVNSAIGAMGLGSSLVLVGSTLHAFTFDTTTDTPQYSEHWVVTIPTPVQITQLPSLPASKRRLVLGKGAGFGTSGAFIDPKNKQRLIVVGRWGELIWRDLKGKDLKYEAFPGLVNLNNATWIDELWRGVAINTNTHALGLGDHNGASIDERRVANSPGAKEPFSNNIAKAIRPAMNLKPKDVVYFTIAGMTYVSGTGSYRTIGTGCPDGKSNGIPRSYASGSPSRGNANFGLHLYARPMGTKTPTAAILLVSTLSSKINLNAVVPACMLHLNPNTLGLLAPIGSIKNEVSINGIPLPNKRITVYTEWALFAPTTNRLGLVFSDARALIL